MFDIFVNATACMQDAQWMLYANKSLTGSSVGSQFCYAAVSRECRWERERGGGRTKYEAWHAGQRVIVTVATVYNQRCRLRSAPLIHGWAVCHTLSRHIMHASVTHSHSRTPLLWSYSLLATITTLSKYWKSAHFIEINYSLAQKTPCASTDNAIASVRPSVLTLTFELSDLDPTLTFCTCMGNDHGFPGIEGQSQRSRSSRWRAFF